MARVMPRVAMGTAGSSGSPEAEDAAAMAAFTTRSHELISAYRGDGETTGQLRGRCAEAAALGWGGGMGGRAQEEEAGEPSDYFISLEKETP